MAASRQESMSSSEVYPEGLPVNPNSSILRAGSRVKAEELLDFEDTNINKFLKLLNSSEFYFELSILLIHNIPNVEYEFTFYIIDMLNTKSIEIPVIYRLSDFIFAFMFMRVYFLIRTFFTFTIYADLHSKKVCAKYGVEADTAFYVKALFNKRPGLITFLVATTSILFLSYLLRIFERVYYNSCGQIVFDDYFTSIWCVIITMTTVGYGDVYAVSPFGRIISLANAFWGSFLISMLVGLIANVFTLNEKQKLAVTDINKFKQAGATVRASIQYFNAKRDY